MGFGEMFVVEMDGLPQIFTGDTDQEPSTGFSERLLLQCPNDSFQDDSRDLQRRHESDVEEAGVTFWLGHW